MPTRGTSASADSASSVTSWTLSARMPTMVGTRSISISITTMRVSMVSGACSMPNLRRRSATGTTLPRTLMRPLTKGWLPGTSVTGTRSRISRTWVASSAKVWPCRSIVNTSSGRSLVQVFICILPSARGLEPVVLRAAVLDQLRHVEDQRHRAVAEDGGAGERRDIGVQLGQRLDDGLVIGDHLVDHEADQRLAGRDDDHLLIGVWRGRRAELLAQPDERHQCVADIEEVAADGAQIVLRRQLDAFLDRGQRDHVAAPADPHQETVDDGERQ